MAGVAAPDLSIAVDTEILLNFQCLLPALDRLDLPFETDFRSLYAKVGERWWGFPAGSLFGNRIRLLEFLRS